MKIAALCVSTNSVYKDLGLDCYDKNRDTRTFTGNSPVIGHPPCRGYSAYTRHWAKPEPGEMDLALFVTERIATNGGVLEHPQHSRYVKRFIGSDKWKVITVHQSWFGYPTTKKTWLLMPGYYRVPELPFKLEQYGREKQIFENMSHNMRSHTTIDFAKWLINLVKINEI